MHLEPKWGKAARSRRRKAFFYTFAFHLALFGCLLLAMHSPKNDYLPEFKKDWLGLEKVEEVLPSKPIP